ncbi:hypothetical protein CkaCkLH20_07722 [Colletotrichum karsti]|uniref:PWI domain-containing protein n=1 Tax=Colletotrichum karsti TaxID=1095194 RepID=A0A9P6I9Q3_9PEZI|nr:uncharacterized protein CkaCkLH20_07722 [Colletotrichum karsti]KAF9874585.1 hypothetical protein CkaCkLH20_07722 [Colletotrichum karsti]
MSYNPYGGRPFWAPYTHFYSPELSAGNPYGPPPSYGGFPGSNAAPGMAPPPGLGPPPGMSSAPGMAPPPGVQQPNNAQANRQSGLPPSFQAPANLPNINFSAPVIRLGTIGAKPGVPELGRKDSNAQTGGRPGLGMDRGLDQSRAAAREHMQSLVPPTNEEKLRTLFIHKIPDGVGGDDGVERLLNAVGKLRRWDAAVSVLSDGKGTKFGFAQYEDPDSFSAAVDILQDVKVPLKRQNPAEAPPSAADDDDTFDGVEMVKLQVTVDPNSLKYLESYKESRGDDGAAESRVHAARTALRNVVRDLVYPKTAVTDGEGDIAMGNSGENVEVVNIPLAQDDELADIPAEMREVVAAEIAAFRERSNKRDMERLKREEELEEMERNRNGPSRPSRLDSPPPSNSNNIPVGPRGVPNAPSGPRGQNGTRSTSFVNGGISNTDFSVNREDEDTDADDEELYQRELSKQKSEEEKMYLEAERKWVNRERSRAAALEREKDREIQEEESFERRAQEQLEREKAWDDEREASRKNHLYYRDHAAWVKKRQIERADELARDEADRRAEEDERRREAADMEKARGMADSFLDQQAQEMEQRQQTTVSAPAPFKLSLGAAAQRSQAQRAAPQRRTVAEVEGLLDDEEQDGTAKRQLIPIQFEPTTAADKMTEEEISKAVRALAQEIPSEKEGLWNWAVQWDYLDDAIIREKLRPFVEKKIVEYLGVQEELLVEVVEEHLRKHAKPSELVEELVPALDDEAEDMVKKLWRMVIFFTENWEHQVLDLPQPLNNESRTSLASASEPSHIVGSRFAYAQYATDLNYLCNAVINFNRLERLGTSHDMVLIFPESWTSGTSQQAKAIRKVHVEYPEIVLRPFEYLRISKTKASATWADSLNKFHAFDLGEYERVLLFDSDTQVLNSMDHIFSSPKAAVALPRAYWLNEIDTPVSEQVLSSHVMLIEPNESLHKKLVKGSLSSGKLDMDLVNSMFKDSATILPHRRLALLTGEFRDSDHQKYLAPGNDRWDPVKEASNAYLVHFSDWPMPKPWEPRTKAQWEAALPGCTDEGANSTDQPQCADRLVWTGFYEDYDADRKRYCNHWG